MNLCIPPDSLTSFSPGCKWRWKVFERIISDPVEVNCLDEIPLTVAKVPTGINFGVFTWPFGVWNIPVLAAVLQQFDVISTVNEIEILVEH